MVSPIDRIKAVPPKVWLIGGGIVLAVVFLARKGKGSTSTNPSSIVGSAGGGGGGGDTPPDVGGQITDLAQKNVQLGQQVTDLSAAVAGQTGANAAFQKGITDKLAAAAAAAKTKNQQVTSVESVLAGKEQQLQAAYSAQAEARTAIARDTARYSDKLISKTTYQADIAAWQPKLNTANTQISTLTAGIAALQKQLIGLGA